MENSMETYDVTDKEANNGKKVCFSLWKSYGFSNEKTRIFSSLKENAIVEIFLSHVKNFLLLFIFIIIEVERLKYHKLKNFSNTKKKFAVSQTR